VFSARKFNMSNYKIVSLELLRFVSSLMVVIWHYQHFFYPYNTINHLNFVNKDNEFITLFIIPRLGTYGVYIFFCISGIVFSLNYLNKNTPLKEFFIKRFARLYPLHFLTLIIVTLIQIINLKYIGDFQIYLLNDLKHFFLNVFLISGWGFEDNFSFNGPIWSVSVEIIVYFIFFISISFLSKSKYFLIIAIIVLSFLTKNFYFDNEIFSALILFFSGVLLFKLYFDKKFLTLLILSIFLFSFNFFDFFNSIGNYKIILTSVGVCSFFLSINNFFSNIYFQKIFLILGNLTYASYLIHIPLQLIFIFAFYKLNINLNIFNSLYFFLFFIFLVYLISLYIFKFYEKPVGKFIKNSFISK
tara:strand:- start:554 stop:1627 length:1074 start_codon:yes stop_codon:yes gene_type:complete